MAALPLQVLVPAGSVSSFDPASGGGDTCPCGDGVWIEFINAGAQARTVTLVTPGAYRGLAIADRAVPIPANSTVKVPASGDYAGANGRASITYDAPTDLRVGVFRYTS
ncbi:hypothetical protein [Nonomuraea helvata]|uniref:DUF4232 domain-containing protein n=1 Tax=Nonomuraea helvata TaxID=37484 RepID=A0ABV5SI67_9ACTN